MCATEFRKLQDAFVLDINAQLPRKTSCASVNLRAQAGALQWWQFSVNRKAVDLLVLLSV